MALTRAWSNEIIERTQDLAALIHICRSWANIPEVQTRLGSERKARKPTAGEATMTDRGLVGAVLYAKDLQRLVDFYSAVVGVEVQKSEQGFAFLGSKPSQLVIVRIPQHLADTIDTTTPPVPRESTPLKLVFAVDDMRPRAFGQPSGARS